MNLQEGASLRGGKYRIVRELGSGTFGITYLATMKVEVQGPLGKMEVPASVCIKEFFINQRNSRGSDSHSVVGTDGEDWNMYRKRFRKEAENLTKLTHSNIVKVLDVFDENNTTYFVMEYVDGENLNDYLKRNHPLDESDAVEVIKTVGEALQVMHDRRILHLDLKPGNIMRSREGKIYLIDFGLSKQFTDEGNQATSLDFGKGTKGYAPIEQDVEELKEGEFAPTLDVYALGAVMFKLLTGNTPPLALSVLRYGLPIEQLKEYNRSQNVIDAITKAMSPMKEDRYQSVKNFLNHIRNQSNHEDTSELTVVSVESTNDGDTPKEDELPISPSYEDINESERSYAVKIINTNYFVPQKVRLSDKIPDLRPERWEYDMPKDYTYAQILQGVAIPYIVGEVSAIDKINTITLTYHFPTEEREIRFKFYNGANEIPYHLIRPLILESNGNTRPLLEGFHNFRGKEIYYGGIKIKSGNPEYNIENCDFDVSRIQTGVTLIVQVKREWVLNVDFLNSNKPKTIILINRISGERKIFENITRLLGPMGIPGNKTDWDMEIESAYYEPVNIPASIDRFHLIPKKGNSKSKHIKTFGLPSEEKSNRSNKAAYIWLFLGPIVFDCVFISLALAIMENFVWLLLMIPSIIPYIYRKLFNPADIKTLKVPKVLQIISFILMLPGALGLAYLGVHLLTSIFGDAPIRRLH